jgi:hypothetical protein
MTIADVLRAVAGEVDTTGAQLEATVQDNAIPYALYDLARRLEALAATLERGDD